MNSLKKSMSAQLWKHYRYAKKYIYASYDVLSVLVILLSLDRVYKLRSFKGLKAWQVARLIERLPKMMKTLKKF